MSRQIEFRAWDVKNKRMVCVAEIEWNCIPYAPRKIGYYFPGEKEKHSIENLDGRDNKFILQEFTGLTDKDGNKIYEGDIVSWGAHPSEIKFIDGAFTYEQGYIKGNGSLAYCKVIGNILENPELI